LLIPVSDCEGYEQTCNEIADALNQAAEGRFEWAVLEMIHYEKMPMTYGNGSTWYRFNKGRFYYKSCFANNWLSMFFCSDDKKATDWRRA
jgi:hypothetical protein